MFVNSIPVLVPVIDAILYANYGSLCRSLLPVYSTPQPTVSADALHNNAPHRKGLGEKTTVCCVSMLLFVFFRIRRGAFTYCGGDGANKTKLIT